MKFGRVRPQYLLCVCILVVYFSFLTRTYYWDGVLFSLDIESVAHGQAPVAALFHPNHLLYNAFGYLIFVTASRIMPSVRAINVLQALDVLLSVRGRVGPFRASTHPHHAPRHRRVLLAAFRYRSNVVEIFDRCGHICCRRVVALVVGLVSLADTA